jgi:hypothetical protein
MREDVRLLMYLVHRGHVPGGCRRGSSGSLRGLRARALWLRLTAQAILGRRHVLDENNVRAIIGIFIAADKIHVRKALVALVQLFPFLPFPLRLFGCFARRS